jgi:hypothetical protein
MTRFEFLYVLISAVLALALANMCVSWGELLQRRSTVRFYWVHVAWTVLILFIVMQNWWGFFQYRTIDEWSFFAAVTLIGNIVLLALTVAVITPARKVEGTLDLQEFFFEISPVFFSCSALLMFFLAAANSFIAAHPLLSLENVIRAIAISVAMLGATTRSVMVHSILVGSGFVLLTVFIFLQVAA